MADEVVPRLTVGTVSRLRKICHKNGERQHFKLKVVEVFRYLKDMSSQIRGISAASDSRDVFDIVLTDGRFKTTCVVSQEFNDLIYTFRLRKNTILLLTDYSSHVDDEYVDAEPIIILQGLEILGNQNEVDVSKSDYSLPFSVDSSAKEKNGVPLTTSRGCYLPLWNDDDFVGSVWNNPEMEQKLEFRRRIGRVASITDLDDFHASMHRPYPALIGRVVGKSKISFFGKPVDKKYKFPFVANLVIEDKSSVVTVCLWNSMCVNFYKHIAVGDILYVAGYRIVQKYRSTNNTVYTTKPAVKIELSLNPSNPTGEIYRLSSDDLSLEYEIPEVPYRFIDSGSLPQLPQGLICDVAGVITYVSRAEREKKQGGSGFWMYKWLHLRDGSSDFPIIIKLYTCSQPEVTGSIAIGQVTICARMLLKVEMFNSQSPRFTFLTTTRDSQVYSLSKPSDIEGKPFSESNFVHTIIEFRKSDEAKEILCASCHGGGYDFPPLPTNFNAYRDGFPTEKPLQLVSMENIPAILNDLHYIQRVRLTLQGFVVAMEFIPIETAEDDDNLSELSCSLSSAKEFTEEYQSFESETESSSSQVRTPSQTKRERILKGKANRVLTRSMAKKRRADDEVYEEVKNISQKKIKVSEKRASQRKTEEPQVKCEDDNESGKHFPYRVLDNEWKENAGRILTVGLPSAHEHTLPTSSGKEKDVLIQTADGKRFVKLQGYWRFLILGLNRRTVLSAVFFPETRTEVLLDENHFDRQSITPFMQMLSTGETPAGFEVQTLLNCGKKELKKRRTKFVVDVFSHGAGDLQVVLKRAF